MNVRRLLVAVVLLAPAGAAAGEFDAYRVPEHTWRSGSAGLAGRYDRNSFTQGSPGSSAGTRSEGAGALDLSFASGFDSDRRQHSWRARALGSVGGATLEQQNADLAEEADSWDGNTDGVFLVSGNFRTYLEGRDLGVDLSAGLLVAGYEDRHRGDMAYEYPGPDLRYEYRNTAQLIRNQYAGNAVLAFGHGIVRDATVVEDVHVLEQRLLECGTLSRELSPAGREKLAALLAVTPFLSYAHDRPARFEWREVERVLREDGALDGGSLDAYGLLRAMEPYLAVSSQRRTGHFAGLAAMFEHRHDLMRRAMENSARLYAGDSLVQESAGGSSARDDESSDRAYVGVTAEWHRPSGWRVQWGAVGRVMVPARPGEDGLVENVDLTAEWHVADRWQVTGGFRQDRNYIEQGSREDSAPRDDWRTTLAGMLEYYVEDNLSVRLTVSDQQARTRQAASGTGVMVDTYQHAGGVQLGVSYRFLGRVSAPGLFERMTPLP